MSFWSKAWFWLLILSVCLFISAFSGFESVKVNDVQKAIIPFWIWIVFALGIIFLIISLSWYVYDWKKTGVKKCNNIYESKLIPDSLLNPVIKCSGVRC